MKHETETDHFAGLDPWESETTNKPNFRGKFASAADAVRYMTAGKATITLESKKTGTHFTYRLEYAKGNPSRKGQCVYVSLMTGPDNNSNYQYIGHFFIGQMVYWPAKPGKSKISADAPGARAFDWSWRKLMSGDLPDVLEIWHEDFCGRCGRKLTVPTSIAHGFGPECYGLVGG